MAPLFVHKISYNLLKTILVYVFCIIQTQRIQRTVIKSILIFERWSSDNVFKKGAVAPPPSNGTI